MNTTQINLRISNDLLKTAKIQVKKYGYINLQEFIRDALREKIFENLEIKEDYLDTLERKEANTFLSDNETKQLDKKLKKRIKTYEKRKKI